jgi:hypothetical protein
MAMAEANDVLDIFLMRYPVFGYLRQGFMAQKYDPSRSTVRRDLVPRDTISAAYIASAASHTMLGDTKPGRSGRVSGCQKAIFGGKG